MLSVDAYYYRCCGVKDGNNSAHWLNLNLNEKVVGAQPIFLPFPYDNLSKSGWWWWFELRRLIEVFVYGAAIVEVPGPLMQCSLYFNHFENVQINK